MLRELIPHSDQKRDKASFLLEVHIFLEKNNLIFSSACNKLILDDKCIQIFSGH